MVIDKNKIMKYNAERKTVQVPIRVTKSLSKWLTDNKYSPAGIFMEAVKELGYKGE